MITSSVPSLTTAYHVTVAQAKLGAGRPIVDATIINAPSSTKNIDKARDPEIHQTKKGKPVVLRDGLPPGKTTLIYWRFSEILPRNATTGKSGRILFRFVSVIRVFGRTGWVKAHQFNDFRRPAAGAGGGRRWSVV
jgi:hypothetical protein